jgi:YD repeat-containing protein
LDGGERTVHVKYPNSPTGKTTQESRTYDNRARLASVTNIDGLTNRYYYDEHDRLDHEVGPEIAADIDLSKDPVIDPDFDPDTTWIRYFDYNAPGDLTKKTDRDEVETAYTPYWSGKQANITRANTSGGTWTLGNWIYRKDGKPVETFERGVHNKYAYDSIGRMTAALIGEKAGIL